MPETTTDVISLFSPLVFLIVMELSSLARDNISYGDEEAERVPVFIPPSWWIPSLGRLNAIHGMNLLLLSGTLVIIITQLSNLIRTVLSILTVVVWIMLPLLEIDHYGELLKDTNRTRRALYFNGFTGVLLVILIGVANQDGRLVRSFDIFAPSLSSKVVLGLLGAVLYLLVSWLGFLHLFYRDVNGHWNWNEAKQQ